MANDDQPTYLQTITSTSLLEGLKSPDNRSVWTTFDERYRPMIVRYAQRLGHHPV